MMRAFRPVLALLLFCLAFTGLGMERAGAQEFIARQIENLVSTDSLKVKIDGLSGALSGNLRIASVTVADPKGTFLTARDLAMDWSPLAIVRSNVSVQSLTAGQIVLERLPELPPSPKDQAQSGGGLPNITADIQRLAITEFVLGEAIAGTRARLSMNAKLVLAADPTRLETNLDIERLDQPGRVSANILFAPADNRLDVKVAASEPAGGLVATLLKLPGAPPVQLTIDGAGPLSDFMANGALDVGGENAAMLTARVGDTPEGRRVSASLRVAAERFAPEIARPYLRGGAQLDANVLVRPDGVLGIDEAQLASQAVRLRATGTLDRAGPQTVLDLALDAPDGGAVPLRFGSGTGQTVIDVARLQGKLAGALAAANIDLSANLPQAGYGSYAARDLTLALTTRGFDLSNLAGPLQVEAQAASVAMPEGVGARFTQGRVAIAADGALGSNSLSLTNGRITTGAATAGIKGTAALDFSTFDLTLTSDFQTLALSAALVPLAGERTALSGRVLRDANGTLAAQDLSVKGSGLTIAGSARLGDGTVEADVKGTVDVPQSDKAAVSGKADFALQAKGPSAAPDVDLMLDSQGLRVNGRELADLRASARGTFTGANAAGKVEISGTLDGAPLSGGARLATLPSGERRISDLAIRQGPNTVMGDLTITTGAVPTGRLDVAVEDVGPLAALALQQASGDLKGRIDLKVEGDDRPVAAVDLTSTRLLAAGNTLTGASLKLAIADYLGKPLPRGTVRADGLQAGGIAVEGLVIDLSDAGQGTRFDLKARANGAPIEAGGVAAIAPTETSVALDRLSADIRDAAVALKSPARVTIANGVTTIAPLELGIGAGSLRAGGTAGATLALNLVLDRVPLAVANPFVTGLDASGTLTGEADLSGSAAAPQGRFRISGDAIETRQTRAGRLPAARLEGAGSYEGGILTLATARAELGSGSLAAEGRVGADLLDLRATLDKLPVALANGFVSGLDATGTISGRASATGTPARPEARFDIAGTGITAREVADAGVPPIELALAGSYAGSTLRLDQGRATIGNAFVEATGTAGETLDLEARLQDVPVALANGFVSGLKAAGSLSGTARVTGPAAQPNAVFDLSGSGITAEAVRQSGIAPGQLRLAGRFAEGTADLETAVLDFGEASLRASGKVGRVLDLDVQLGRFPVGLANAFVPGLEARGTLSGEAMAKGTLQDPNATFNLTGRDITAERIRASGIAPLTLDIAGRVANKTATIERGRLATGDAFLDLTGTAGEVVDLKLDIQRLPVGLANAFVPNLNAAGTLSGTARATGSLADPQANFELSGAGLTTRQLKAASLKPATLDVAGRYAQGSAEIASGQVAIGGGTLGLSGTVGRRLDLDLALDDLPVALANGFVEGLGASGRLSGSAKASGSLAAPEATFEIEGRSITTEKAKAAKLPLLSLDLSGRYADGTAEIGTARIAAGQGTIEAKGSVGQRLSIDATLARVPVALANAFVADLGVEGTLSGTARAEGSLSAPSARFDLRAETVSTRQTRAARTPALNAVAAGRFENGNVEIETGRVTVGGGVVELTGRAGRELDLDVAIRNLPASLASAAASGIDPTGTINGSARATGPAADPQARFDLNVAGLTLAQTRDAGIGPLAIRANGEFANKVLRLDTVLSGGGGLDFRANGTVGLAGTPDFDLRANGTAPLALANRILAEGGRSAQGTVRVDVAVTGTAAAPNVNGTISTAGASFTDTGANVSVRNIATTITLSGQTATISSFRANLAAGGTITAGGTLGLSNGFPADLSIRVADGRYADGELVAARLDAALTITGQLTGTPRLAGSIDVKRMDILVPSRFPTSLARIDVTRRNAPPRVAKQQRELFPPRKAGGGGGGIDLDIAFNAPSEIFVRGRGLDVQMGGSLRIQGSAAAPSITGGFDLTRGRLVILNKRLDFQSGRLGFTGGLIPLLDFVATSDSGDVTVNVTVTGPANDPSFSFSSSPALPQDEVLARLIFNQGTTNLSPLQIAQLAEAAAQLAGVGGSTGLLENLRSQIGVDDLDLRTTADGQTAVGVGKYLNDRTYLGVDSTGRASINIDIGKGLKASGAVTAKGGGEVGIFYEHEY
ncbi:translocation/assembly module TamB [Aureimonas endophytica]|uniref:Translocation/assembly module TamB n=1 Tax=Aureimonas endophytica TaxID=2027858 RepID=A0A917E464_9HYPH|nr:translocation/assembly module TamB domain-containing protein [Aureimonas endophytica]GGD99764.1 translocation/assembly module TamB [Aureimonas endophytica]